MSREQGKAPPVETITFTVPLDALLEAQQQEQQQQQQQQDDSQQMQQKNFQKDQHQQQQKQHRPGQRRRVVAVETNPKTSTGAIPKQQQPAQKVTLTTVKLERPSDFDEYLQEGTTTTSEQQQQHRSRMQPLGDNTINVPAFLGKLWRMVNDPETDHLISWNAAGNSFVIQNQAQFWYDLLPVYYKHNNMSSFVRQLNMYGFHKVSSVENGTMDAERDEIVFFHPYFQRDRAELLRNIKRKVTGPKHHAEAPGAQAAGGAQTAGDGVRSDELSKVLVDVKQIRGRQAAVDSQLSQMKQENAVLWRELALLRQKHLKQQQIVNKLIHFLLTLVQPAAAARMHGVGVGVKRRHPLMLCERPAARRRRHHHPSASSAHSGGPAASPGGSEASAASTASATVVRGAEGEAEEECPTAGPPRNPRPSLGVFGRRQDGPTIHELDAAGEMELPKVETIYEEVEEMPLVDSPPTSAASSTSSKDGLLLGASFGGARLSSEEQTSAEVMEELSNDGLGPDILWDKPDLIKPGAIVIGDDGEMIETLHHLEEEEEEAIAAEAAAAMTSAPSPLSPSTSSTAGASSGTLTSTATEALASSSTSALKPADVQRVFLNPGAQDTLLSNLINGNYNSAALGAATAGKRNIVGQTTKPGGTSTTTPTLTLPLQQQQQRQPPSSTMTLATTTKDPSSVPGLPSPEVDELHSLVGSTENDLDQLKDLLANCNGLDANALLGLFSDPDPEYGLSLAPADKDLMMMSSSSSAGAADTEAADPMVSGNELSTYGLNMIDFNELFGDDSMDGTDVGAAIPPKELDLGLNTPQVEPGDPKQHKAPEFRPAGGSS